MALYSCLLRFCECKSCSTGENKDSSWKGPVRLKLDLVLNDLCSEGSPMRLSLGIY